MRLNLWEFVTSPPCWRVKQWGPLTIVYHQQFLSPTTQCCSSAQWRQPQQIAFRGGGHKKRGRHEGDGRVGQKDHRSVRPLIFGQKDQWPTTLKAPLGLLTIALNWTISSLLKAFSRILKPSGGNWGQTDEWLATWEYVRKSWKVSAELFYNDKWKLIFKSSL